MLPVCRATLLRFIFEDEKVRALTSCSSTACLPVQTAPPVTCPLVTVNPLSRSVRRIGNRFLPPPLFLHEPGRFEGTPVDSSRLDGCQQTLDGERVRPQTTRRQSVTETRSNGFDSLRPPPLPLYEECFRCASIVQGSVRLSAGRRAGPARQRKCRNVLRGGSALLCLCPPATRTRRWPTRDRRSVTTAGVAMVPRSA